jgi:hypothetical protein
VDLAADALSDSRAVSLKPIIAETVPELVSATAVPEELGEGDEPNNRFRCGINLGFFAALVFS